MRLTFFAASALVFAVIGASSDVDKSVAIAGVEKFHQQFNDEKFDNIWASADEGFRSDILVLGSRKMYDASMEERRRRLGRTVASHTQTIQRTESPSVITLVQDTRFEHGSAIEYFTFDVRAGAPKLVYYAFSSPEYTIQ